MERQVRAAHLPQILQRSRDLLQLRPAAPQVTEPRSERQGRYHHGQCLYLRRGEQCAQREERRPAPAEWQDRQNANKDKSLHVNVNQRDSVR